MLKNDKIVILLAAFNGEQFIEDQIKSIQAQTFKNWQLMIRDDKSSDSTTDILEILSDSDTRIKIINDQHGNVGVIKNFEYLMKKAQSNNAGYFAFCDQDDLWKPDKLQKQFIKMKNLETQFGHDVPILIFTDLAVADQKLDIVNCSFMDFQGISNAQNTTLGNLLKQNIVVGNTMLINAALLQLSLPFPSNIHMHDWWIALCASSFGIIKYLPCQTVIYRLHEKNQVGAAGLRMLLNPFNLKWRHRLKKMNNIFVSSFLQAISLKKKIDESHNDIVKLERSMNIINRHLKLLSSNSINRLLYFLKTKQKCKTKILSLLFAIQLSNPIIVKKVRSCTYHEIKKL